MVMRSIAVHAFCAFVLVCNAQGFPAAGPVPCVSQGITRRIGDSWKPNLEGFGPGACVMCTCKESGINCGPCEMSNAFAQPQPQPRPLPQPKPQPQAAPAIDLTQPSTNSHKRFGSFRQPTKPGIGQQLDFTAKPGNKWRTSYGRPSQQQPSSAGCFVRGIYRNHGDFFAGENRIQSIGLPLNPRQCSQCVCMKGEVYCRTKICSETCRTPASQTSDQDCCPACREPSGLDSPISGFNEAPQRATIPFHNIQTAAETFNSAQHVSTKLTNQHGSGGCFYQGKTYARGEVWKLDLPLTKDQPCVECTCKDEGVKCTVPKCKASFPNQSCQSDANRCCKQCRAIDTSLVVAKEKGETNCLNLRVNRLMQNDVNDTVRIMNGTGDMVYVMSIEMSTSVRVYNWTLSKDSKRREILNLRPQVYERFKQTHGKAGTFTFAGYTSEKRLRSFQRKEARWSKKCRRFCQSRLRRILKVLRLAGIPGRGAKCQSRREKSDAA